MSDSESEGDYNNDDYAEYNGNNAEESYNENSDNYEDQPYEEENYEDEGQDEDDVGGDDFQEVADHDQSTQSNYYNSAEQSYPYNQQNPYSQSDAYSYNGNQAYPPPGYPYGGDSYSQSQYYSDPHAQQQQGIPSSYSENEDVDQLSGMQRLNLDAPDEVSHANQQCEEGGAGSAPAFNFGSVVKGALDGFGNGSMQDIVGKIGNITGGGGGLTNIMASGGLESMASGLIANAAHRFFGINPETGRIIGAIAGNIIFHLGGKDNSLSGIGKIVLDNIVSGKYQRKVDPFVPATPGMPSFNLNFIEERTKCLREKRLFEDPEFPAVDSSLYFSKPPKKQIEWRRPGEIVNDPQLIVSKQSRFDVVQGALGDCWLLAAAANLTLRDELFYRVVPPDQSFTENYAGIFHFQFWRYGKWVDVVIDDRLPTHNGQLVYMHSAEHNEFWSALLEKAYAKLYGNYETLKGGSTAEAMEDFTGGLIEYFDLQDAPREQMLAMLVRGFQMGSLFGCSIDADANVIEAQMDNGLVRGHAYSITALQTVHTAKGELVLLRIRNPWGEHEWNGPWSDNSSEWNYVSSDQRQKLGVSFSEDGEFWMSIDDFLREFQRMENCNLGPEVMDEIYEMTGLTDAPKSAWSSYMADGGWVTMNGTAGGCKNHIETFANNPQYSTTFTTSGNALDHDGHVTVIVAVLQKYRRELRVKNLDSLPIGFTVFRSSGGAGSGRGSYYGAGGNYYGTDGTGYGGSYYGATQGHQGGATKMNVSFFKSAQTVAKSPSFIDMREVTTRFRVEPGTYIIVPSTFDPNEDAEFLLRVFSSEQISATELR